MEKYRYQLKGLDCPNCALKIEKKLNEHSKLKNVSINFSKLQISYETSLSNSFQVVNELIQEIDSNVSMILDKEIKKEYHLSYLLIALILLLIYIFTNFKIFIYLAYLILLYKPALKAFKMLLKSHTINENMLITISCIGALLVGNTLEGIMVVFLYLIGKILEEKALNKTRNSVSELLSLKQDYANLVVSSKIKKIPVSKVEVNDLLIVKKGEMVPVDGIIYEGKTKFDTSFITGEAELVELDKNDNVLSGFINNLDIVTIKATSKYQDSMIFKILNLIEEASDKKAKVETIVSKLSRIYTPVVLVLAVLVSIFLPLILDISYKESIYRALTFLVIACPCAIAISVPLSYFIGIGISSSNGILIKGSNYLDNLAAVKKIIFDKTGTLTTGSFEVSDLIIKNKKYQKEEIIEILRSGESLSNHPIAKAIIKLSFKKIDNSKVSNYHEIDGVGICFNYEDSLVKIGNSKILNNSLAPNIYLTINDSEVAELVIFDGLKKNACDVINKLHEYKIETYMFTGDNLETANFIGNKLKIKNVFSNMLPSDKYKEYENIAKDSEIVAFVGDGVNDAPVIKRASIGISMGAMGSDAAINSSDIVIMKDDLAKIILAIEISKYTNLVIKENLIVAIGVKILILLLSIFGLSSMWFAVFADTGLTVLTILNSLRINYKFKKKN